MRKYYFLPEDMIILRKMAEQFYENIRELGVEQGEAARQSTEIFGHDDACQEAVDLQRRVVVTRLGELNEIINKAVVVNPEGPFEKVRLGAIVELSDGRIIKIGSFMVFANHQITNVSYNSPLGRALVNKEEGDEIDFKGKRLIIKSIL